MSKPIVIGFLQSTYVWTARAALNYKGVDYEMQAIASPVHKSPEYLARHPWGKVPAFEHGDVRLYETTAICSYVDTAFAGPELTPRDPVALAKMHQIISIANSYLYPVGVPRFVLQYIFPSGPEGKPNESVIAAAKPELRHTLEVLDRELGDGKWFAGDSLTLADLFVAPLLLSVSHFPGGAELFDGLGNLGRFKGQIVGEAKFMSAAPQS